MARGENGLPVGRNLPILAENVSVPANNLFRLGIPDDELLVTVLAGVEFVEVEAFACAAAGSAEGYFAQSSYLTDNMGRVLPRDDIHFVVAFVCHPKFLVGR